MKRWVSVLSMVVLGVASFAGGVWLRTGAQRESFQPPPDMMAMRQQFVDTNGAGSAFPRSDEIATDAESELVRQLNVVTTMHTTALGPADAAASTLKIVRQLETEGILAPDEGADSGYRRLVPDDDGAADRQQAIMLAVAQSLREAMASMATATFSEQPEARGAAGATQRTGAMRPDSPGGEDPSFMPPSRNYNDLPRDLLTAYSRAIEALNTSDE